MEECESRREKDFGIGGRKVVAINQHTAAAIDGARDSSTGEDLICLPVSTVQSNTSLTIGETAQNSSLANEW